jgi:hyperosmotically inducible protein
MSKIKSISKAARNLILSVFLFVFLSSISGCAAMYFVAADERDMQTIIQDTNIKETIVQALKSADEDNFTDIFVACYNGYVYLVGEYKTEAQKKEAIEIARRYEGVKMVMPYLLPKKEGEDPGCAKGYDRALTLSIKTMLITDGAVKSTNVDVKVVQCNVALMGYVGSEAEARSAVYNVTLVEGVRSVLSFLRFKSKN